jgi:hypothetical protein
MPDGFLGRWSRRKLEVKEGREVASEAPQAPVIPAEAGIQGIEEQALGPRLRGDDAARHLRGDDAVARKGEVGEEPPLPTLQDVQALTPASDFSRFTGAKVAPEVKNAAMKKLFADPRYNVMDMMDVYVDDYSKPDPMPESMLRSLASAQFLKLFDEPPKEEAGPRDVADDPGPQTVAQSGPPSQAVPAAPDHAHPDLRLQQDDAAEPPEAGDGAR